MLWASNSLNKFSEWTANLFSVSSLWHTTNRCLSAGPPESQTGPISICCATRQDKKSAKCSLLQIGRNTSTFLRIIWNVQCWSELHFLLNLGVSALCVQKFFSSLLKKSSGTKKMWTSLWCCVFVCQWFKNRIWNSKQQGFTIIPRQLFMILPQWNMFEISRGG